MFVSLFAEKAREYLHKTGRFIVIGGIISPVHDSYGKAVSILESFHGVGAVRSVFLNFPS